MRCAGEAVCDGAGLRKRTAVGAVYVLPEIREELAAGRLRSSFPFGANCGDGFVGFVFTGGGGGDEIAVVDYDGRRQFLRGRYIAGGHRRAEGRRAQDLSVHQARGAQIGSVLVAPGYERATVYFRQRFARDRPCGWRRDWVFVGDSLRERFASREIGVGCVTA